MRRAILLCLLLLVGCGSTGVVPAGGDTYFISKKAGGPMGSHDGARADILGEAGAYCGARGEKFETLSIEDKSNIPFVRTGSTSITFRCAQR